MSGPQQHHSEEAVNRLASSLFTAWNRHDSEAFSAPFAEDADFTNVFGMRARGRQAIGAFHAPIFATMFKDSTLSQTGISARFLRPDVAAIDVGWEMTGARDPLGNEWPMRRGLMSLIAICEDGAWSLAVMHNMDLPDTQFAEAQAAIQAQ